ncbi:glycosyltransferase involved in cell wall biosynthesis [Rhodopirellula rubra]|uniref:Glycosyltransferase involved in cell wall biosynthesis n=1 Tax=Aporhodopirellula rubra TaxID=980271 RepID=A0A7W5DXE3_9BACT|nr:glycosyltransferase family 4 protein [Aporhodopirellula rubra]MBB3206296.1 glycosyltransferase involved in cell wall biosynthesis [Aporhodopirellula rubra]
MAARDDIDFRVFFAMLPDAAAQGAGFGVEFTWDIPLLEGYPYHVLKNISAQPSVTHFRGCDTPDITDELQRHQIDVVVVNGWVVKTCLQTLWACRKLGIPCIVRGEANNLRDRARWKRWLQRQLVRRYDAFLPIGSASRQFYRQHGIAETRLFDSPYCIENERFAKAAATALLRKTAIQQRWGLSEDRLCLLYCGKFETKKHPVELVKAIAAAKQRGANLQLLMVGDGELRRECEDFSKKHDLPIQFTGFLNQSEIVDAYVAADVLALPSDAGETWGLVVNEAMACGLPAIVSNRVGCAEDLIVPDETGWVFPFGDWPELIACMEHASQNVGRVRAMRTACIERIKGFTPQIAADGIVQAVGFATRRC